MEKRPNLISTNPYFDMVKIKTESNHGIIKTLVLVLLIALQFVLMLLFQHYLLNVFNFLMVLSVCLTLVFCILTLSSNKTGQTKATWIFFMLVCLTFGWAIFIFSNEKIMFGRNKKKYAKIYSKKSLKNNVKSLEKLPKSVKNDCVSLRSFGDFPTYELTDTTYIPSGAQFFDSVLEDIKKAKKYIFIEFFILSNGVLLNRMLSELEQKVKEGVDVRIIYDDMGSHHTLKYKTKKQITKMGIKLSAFNKLVPVFNLALNLRDHRKIVVIDGKIAYTGGTNLADEYINEKRLHGYWKDCGIKITGEPCNTFTLAFLRQWEFITKKPQNYDHYLLPQKEVDSAKEIIVPYVSGPDYKHNIAGDVYENMIAGANEKIYIMTPYFVPDETLMNLLKNKAQSGVDVRIILPKMPDKKMVYLITLDNAERLIKYGIKVYCMENAFVHSKVVLTENSCVVGSINLDQRSLYQQFESAVYSNSAKLLKDVEQDFLNTLSRCSEHTNAKKGIFKRTLTYILRIISPLM